MTKRSIAVTMFLCCYGLLTGPWIFWPPSSSALQLLAFALYSLLAVGLAVEITELILALVWSPQTAPLMAGAVRREGTAVLMVVCDDASAACVESLVPLAVAGYDVYLLDDSHAPVALSQRQVELLAHLRRPGRCGAKAGNLNHWLARRGARYESALLLDADSQLTVEAADTLLRAAGHPANADVALFQAKIEPQAGACSLMAKILATGARPRMRVMERVHGPLGLLLSFGHNQLIRLQPVRELGGFEERLTNEDTVLSLRLAAAGQRAALVDVWTTDTEPATVSAYIRRTLRWARQTVELFHDPWPKVPLRLKLLLCRQLLAYLLPLVGLLLLGISLGASFERPTRYWQFLAHALALRPGYELYGLTFWSTFTASALFIALRIVLARLTGVEWRALLLAGLLGNAPAAVMLLPLAGSMLASASGLQTKFIPTNSGYARQQDAQIARRLTRWLTTGVLLSGIMAIVLRHPTNLLLGFNLLWVAYLLLSPVSLFIISIWQRGAETRSRVKVEAD
ncbi:MAG: hypothetical protein DMF64_02260 [Acidobacteria bacterium]|nr:MAG: hypothetical protein DMF64_02260 [Acidobacteriota bacterium]